MTTADIVITNASWIASQEEHHRKKALDVMVTGRRSIDRVTNRQKGKLYIDRETEEHADSRAITSIRHGTAHDMKTRAVVPNGQSTMAMQAHGSKTSLNKTKTVRAKHAALTIETCDARA